MNPLVMNYLKETRRCCQWLAKGLFSNFNKGFSEAINFGEECGKDDSKTTTIGNDTLLGKIASFMDSLHLSYQEVVREIPYRNLLLMAKDKQRVACGDVMYEVTEEEFGMNFKKDKFKIMQIKY